MSHAATTPEEELTDLGAIVIEAGNKVAAPPKRSGLHANPVEEHHRVSADHEVPAWARPLLLGIETLSNAHNENALRLDRIEKCLSGTEPISQVLGEARHALDQRNIVNRVMFEALHTELKSYKDAFMLEAVLRPILRDLIALYDDILEIHRQTTASIAAQEARGEMRGSGIVLLENVATMSRNLEHNVHFILEVLERMDVIMIPENLGKLDKRTQRAVSVEVAERPEQDNMVVKIVKRGFQCRDRVIRAEEVVIQKWKEGCLVALPTPNPPPSR